MSVSGDSPLFRLPLGFGRQGSVHLSRGARDSVEESGLQETLPRARIQFSESSSRSSDRVAVDIFNVQLERLRVQAGTPSPNQPLIPDIFGEDLLQFNLREKLIKSDTKKLSVTREQNSNSSLAQVLGQLKNEGDEYITQTEWMFRAPRHAPESLKKFY